MDIISALIDTHCKNSPPPTCTYTTCTGLYVWGACKEEWKNDPDKQCSDDTPGKVEDDCQIECKLCGGECYLFVHGNICSYIHGPTLAVPNHILTLKMISALG